MQRTHQTLRNEGPLIAQDGQLVLSCYGLLLRLLPMDLLIFTLLPLPLVSLRVESTTSTETTPSTAALLYTTIVEEPSLGSATSSSAEPEL